MAQELLLGGKKILASFEFNSYTQRMSFNLKAQTHTGTEEMSF